MSQPKIFMPDAHPEERRRVMSDTADKKETGTYIKVLSEEEIYERRELLADSSIKLREISEEKKAVLADFKAKEDPVKKQIDNVLTQLKTGQEDRIGDLYLMANHTDGVMEYFDNDGNFIKSRRLKPEERQGKIYNLGQASGM
jgi:hypothetical protein